MRARLSEARRIVVKIGSSLLVERQSGVLRGRWLASLADDLARLHKSGRELLIVSSGAIALGREALGLAPGKLRLEESQAAAAVGQIDLAHAWEDALRTRGLVAAQVLVTLGDTEERRRYLNARSTISTLLRLGAVPVVNENDTVATSEIRYGDNDRLAARVATMTSADCLVVLSDVDGLFTGAPDGGEPVKLIPHVRAITPQIEAMAGAAGTDYGTGGMMTKIEAAKIALAAGTCMVITRGSVDHPLTALEKGAPCTWFEADASPVAARKKWIAGSLEPSGTVIIDEGAARALRLGKSLLPAGIKEISGKFERGDALIISDHGGNEMGRGLSAYSKADAERIIGYKSREIERILGYRGRAEMIHRDDMVLKRE